MNKIKMSFTKVLPFIFIFNIVLITLSNITNLFSHMVINYESPAWYSLKVLLNMAIAVAVSPLYIGFYRFCFERTNGRKPHILTVFDFYRSAAGFVKSAAAYLVSVVAFNFVARAFSYLTMFSIFASRDENTEALFAAAIIALVILVLGELFFLAPYAYAESPSDGLAAAIKKSIKRGFKFMIVLVLLYLADILASQLILTFYKEDIYDEVLAGKAFVSIAGFFFDFDLILTLILHSIMSWSEFTAAYMILGVSPKKQNAAAETAYPEPAENTENDEGKPFIEPYDFCIEADERFSDEKIIETEDIRGVDILAALEEMDLAFDVVNHFGIRRKLKKMFDDLSFEISEFVTYEGGRSIENFFTEKIDEREFEVSAEISKASDYEPFKLILRVDISDNE